MSVRLICIAVAGGFVLGITLLFVLPHRDMIVPHAGTQATSTALMANTLSTTSLEQSRTTTPVHGFNDIPAPGPLANPPEVVKALYLTGWSGGSEKKVNAIIDVAKRTEVNAVVVDIKDYSGYVSYAMDVPEVKTSGAEGEIRIAHPNAMLKKLHDNGIYVIGRITVFQDPILAVAHPEWALKNKTTGKVWLDHKGLAWMDAAGKSTWDYVISIAKDALVRGFDEINFDYVRFASDGTLNQIEYPFWDQKSARHTVIKKFFSYLRDQLGNARLSADLFGLATVNQDDLGIGQVIEDAYRYFDYISPMIYPSHYASGFLGYKNPGAYPYEVMSYSLDHAVNRLLAMAHPPIANASTTSSTAVVEPLVPPRGKLRPWIQDFNLGAVYDAAMVRKEFKAVTDSLNSASTTGQYTGWLVWSASNNYTIGALDAE